MTIPHESGKTNHGKSPEVAKIEELLGKIQPMPRDRFHKKMGTQPWNRNRFWYSLSIQHPRALPITLFLGLILAVVASFFSPSLEALANRIGQFFTPSSNNQVTVQVPSTDLSDPDLRFSLSLEEAKSFIDFPIKTPSLLPEGYQFKGAAFNSTRDGITLNYQTETGLILRISQRPSGKDYQRINILADVEMVFIGSIPGEYVTGGWKAVAIDSTNPDSASTVTLEAAWDSEANIHFLRWQENDILYELFFIGFLQDIPGTLDKQDLIAIAKDLRY